MKLFEEKRFINDIPVLICKKVNEVKKPLVILSHGFNGCKENFKEKGYLQILADMGYYAVALDNRCHGERPGVGLATTIMNSDGKVNLSALRKAIKETADDIKVLIDEFVKDKEVDQDKIAMMGVSMGGFITFKALAMDARITVGIPIISSPYWDDMPDGKQFKIENEKLKMDLKYYCETHQPAVDIDKFFPRAILMQVGNEDKHFEVNKVKEFYQRLKVFYEKSPENISLIIYSDIKHEFTKEMWDESVRWLQVNFKQN